MSFIPSQGFWSAGVERGRRTIIKPRAFMRLSRAALPYTLREVKGAEAGSTLSYRSRLVIWEALPGATEEHDGAMLTTLVPFKTENATLDLLLSPGLTYAFEVAGGGGGVHISGRFEEVPHGYEVEDTEIRVVSGRGSRSLLKPTVQKEGPIVKSEPADE